MSDELNETMPCDPCEVCKHGGLKRKCDICWSFWGLNAWKNRAAQAEADRDTLAAEVEAWRHNDNVHECSLTTELEFLHKRSVKAHDRACEAAQRTDESGALQRAKEAK